MRENITIEGEARTANSTYPKGGVSCFKVSFVVNQTLVLHMKFSENRELFLTKKRYA